MLTPSFHISQTDEELIITIHAPYTHLKDIEINALGSQFWFYSSPYFLRLKFPNEIVDNDEPPASFDADKGEFKVILRKLQPGQYFPDVDLLGTLLAPKKHQDNIKPSIEVLTDDVDGDEEASEEEDPDEWLIDQELPLTEPEGLLNLPKYGFGNLTSGVFRQVKSEFKEIIDLPDPDNTSASQREVLRRLEEDHQFSSDYYLADLMEPEVLQEYMEYTPPWASRTVDDIKLTHKERECLKKLGNKDFLLSKEEEMAIMLSLIDIVFAFAYNHRTTLGENTVESAWTINKLSATLSWLTTHRSLKSAIICSFRRLLTYSLYRNWDLAQLVLKDTIAIFKLGRRQVLKCLLEVHSLFSKSEPRYLLNQLYISDYCVWLQRVSEHRLAHLADTLEQVSISKSDMGFDLEDLENAALLVLQEEENEALAHQVGELKLESCDTRSSSSCSSYDSGSSSSSEDSSLDSDDQSAQES